MGWAVLRSALLLGQFVIVHGRVVVTSCTDLKSTIEAAATATTVDDVGEQLVVELGGTGTTCSDSIAIAPTQSVHIVGGDDERDGGPFVFLNASGIRGESGLGGRVGSLFVNEGILELREVKFNLDYVDPQPLDNPYGTRVVLNYGHLNVTDCKFLGLDSNTSEARVNGQAVSVASRLKLRYKYCCTVLLSAVCLLVRASFAVCW